MAGLPYIIMGQYKYKKHRGGMQYEGHITTLGYHVLTKACRAEVSMVAKGCSVA